MLKTAIEAAKRAGQVIVDKYPTRHTPTVKGYRDITTEVDVAAEGVILDLIRARFPEHAILSEEAGGAEIGRGYTWVVDPLDGTSNYAHQVPIFAVSIGVLERGKPVVGVIHDPLRGHTFAAERGNGATLDSEPIGASGTRRLHKAIVGVDWGHEDEERRQTFDVLLGVALRCHTVRALGSAALAQAYVAAGWLDGYFNLFLKPWDVAAGMLIVAEAGGRCSTPNGEPYRVGMRGCLATNSLVHDELLDALSLRLGQEGVP